MHTGINNTFLYSACKISCTFSNGSNSINTRGTGFFINKGSIPYLITNRHVVDFDYYKGHNTGYQLSRLLVDNRHFDPATQLPTDIVTFELHDLDKIVFSQERKNDIACLYYLNNIELLPHKDGKAQKCEVAFHIPYDLLATENDFLTKLNVCDFIGFSGYPNAHDVRNNNPIFRMGSIASDPRTNYSFCEDFVGDIVAYDGLSSGGASGSPVFSLQKGFEIGGGLIKTSENFYRRALCVGINAGHVKEGQREVMLGGYCVPITGLHSGISYFYKSTEIIKIIDEICPKEYPGHITF